MKYHYNNDIVQNQNKGTVYYRDKHAQFQAQPSEQHNQIWQFPTPVKIGYVQNARLQEHDHQDLPIGVFLLTSFTPCYV